MARCLPIWTCLQVFIFTYSFTTSTVNETNVYFNYVLETSTCLTPVAGLSFKNCRRRFEENLDIANVLVYRRKFYLCQFCFASSMPTRRRASGYVSVQQELSGNNQQNLALGKPSSQSSTLDSRKFGTFNSSLAVDGLWQSNLISGSGCTHTNNEDKTHWWMVNFEQTSLVSSITILNRSGCCADRLSNITITVGNDMGTGMTLCATYVGPGSDGERVHIKCKTPLYGQFLKLEKPGPTPLTLCEVGVYS